MKRSTSAAVRSARSRHSRLVSRAAEALAIVGLGLAAGGAGFGQTAPPPVITTVAGTDFVFPPTPIAALQAPLALVTSVAVDSAGNVITADQSSVYRITPAGELTIVAGNGIVGFSGDGGNATAASLANPIGVPVDAAGNIYIADNANNRIRRVSPSGVIVTVAGDGDLFLSGDGGPATDASLVYPFAVAVDAAGNLYIADANRIRKVSLSGIINTVAGGGKNAAPVDGAPVTSVALADPSGMAVDAAGNLYIADTGNNRVRKYRRRASLRLSPVTGTTAIPATAGPRLPLPFLSHMESLSMPPAISTSRTQIITGSAWFPRRASSQQ